MRPLNAEYSGSAKRYPRSVATDAATNCYAKLSECNFMSVKDFKEWYDAVYIGDGERYNQVPSATDKNFPDYMMGYTLAYGAWIEATKLANYDVALIASERDDAIRHAAKIANAFQDLHNDYGEIPEIKAAYKKVELLISDYAGLERIGV